MSQIKASSSSLKMSARKCDALDVIIIGAHGRVVFNAMWLRAEYDSVLRVVLLKIMLFYVIII